MRLNLNVRLLAVLMGWLAVSLLAPVVSAQTNHARAKTNAPAPEGNRFLLIVDTSASMKSSTNDTLQAVDELLQSGASGQMHRGDTLGVWTFNTQLYPGVLPLQTWTPEMKSAIAARTGQFLTQQHYGNQSSFSTALEGTFKIIKMSDIITVFIISNGQSPMQGTPFDDQINALYAENLKEMKHNKKPIVTVLQAKSGQIIKYTVNALPWPVVVPEAPISLKETEVAAKTPPPAETEKPVTPEATKPVPPPPTPATNVAQPKPAPAVAQNATPPAPKPNPTPAAIAPPPAVPVPNPQPTPTPTPPSSPSPAVAQNPSPAPAVPPPNPVPVPVVKSPTAAPAKVAMNNPPPAPASKPAAHTNAPTTATPPSSASTGKPEPRPIAAVLTQPKFLLIGAIALAVLGFALCAMLFLRSRASSGPSLITRTMNVRLKK